MGSGTTAVAALRGGRRFVGYDTESEYVRIAEQRIVEEKDRLLRDEPPDGPTSLDARRNGATAREWARDLLTRCGFADVREKVRVDAGVEVDLTGVDGTGRQWLFDIWGSFTTVQSGLRRADTLWRALGKAAVVRTARPELPLVLLTTSTPRPGSPGDRAWRALGGSASGGALVDVVEFDSAQDLDRLSGYAHHGLPGAGGTRSGTTGGKKNPRRAEPARPPRQPRRGR
jgi:hypothetical protein